MIWYLILFQSYKAQNRDILCLVIKHGALKVMDNICSGDNIMGQTCQDGSIVFPVLRLISVT